jgi:hypothetical protein
MGVSGQRHDPAALPPGKDTQYPLYWVGPRVGPDGCRKSRSHQNPIPDGPARSESIHRPRYSGPYERLQRLNHRLRAQQTAHMLQASFFKDF